MTRGTIYGSDVKDLMRESKPREPYVEAPTLCIIDEHGEVDRIIDENPEQRYRLTYSGFETLYRTEEAAEADANEINKKEPGAATVEQVMIFPARLADTVVSDNLFLKAFKVAGVHENNR